MIQEVLNKVAASSSAPSALEIERLAGLSPEDLAEFRTEWPKLDAERRRAILQVAVQLGENDVELDFTPIFKVALQDPDAAVRAVAVDGLWEDDEFRTADQLAQMLRHDSAENVRVAAALGLARFATLADAGLLYAPSAKRVRAALLEAAHDPNETADVRRRAIESVAVFDEQEVVDLIEAAYADPDPHMRASAVYAMGRSCDSRWLETILGELESDSAEMRFEAARAAGEMAVQRAIVPLITRLDDDDLEVRLAAVGALGEIGGDLAKKALQRCATSKDEALRLVATEALNELNLDDNPLDISPFQRDSTRTI